MKIYEIEFHILPKGSLVCGAPSQVGFAEADSEEEALAKFMEANPEARVGYIREVVE